MPEEMNVEAAYALSERGAGTPEEPRVQFGTVLFLVAISQRFTYRAVRQTATALAGALMIFALLGVATLPRL